MKPATGSSPSPVGARPVLIAWLSWTRMGGCLKWCSMSVTTLRACVNPGHLRAGDHQANMLDMARKGRGAHQKLTPADCDRIRELADAGWSHCAIAREIKTVSRTAVRNLLIGATHGPVATRGEVAGT